MRRRTRSSWNWDLRDYVDGPWPNSVSPINRGETGNDKPKATLWLPNPEYDSGWELSHVWPEADTPGEPRRMGFTQQGNPGAAE